MFSGDYTEHTLVYTADLIWTVKVDLAVLDSACGTEPRTAEDMRLDILTAVEKTLPW